MKPLKLGVLGLSNHYRLRLQIPLKSSPKLILGALASRSLERGIEAAKTWGYDRAYGSYQELLDDPEIEAVYIPLPNHLHVPWIKKSIDAGKAVICEKPLALNAKEAAEAIEYAASRAVLLMEAFMYRFHPQWHRAQELVAAGEIGKIKIIQTVFCYNNQDPRNIRNILAYGGGGLLDIGCYAVSLARFLMGREPLRVLSLLKRDPEFGTDTLSSGILDFGEAQSTFTVSTNSFSRQEVRVVGTGGSLSIPLPFNAYPDVPLKIVVENSVGRREIWTDPQDQYALMLESFAQAVREGGPPPIPPSDALENMKVLDALFASEKTGNWVHPALS